MTIDDERDGETAIVGEYAEMIFAYQDGWPTKPSTTRRGNHVREQG